MKFTVIKVTKQRVLETLSVTAVMVTRRAHGVLHVEPDYNLVS